MTEPSIDPARISRPRPLGAAAGWATLRIIGAFALSSLLGMAAGREAALAAPLPGDPEAGRILVIRQSCGSCHQIPRLQQAVGLVGPSLAGIARRVYLAGHILNTPDNMAAWLRDPQALKPGNAMPNSGLTDSQARDIAAYLFTLK